MQGAVIVYDITDGRSLEIMKTRWLHVFREVCLLLLVSKFVIFSHSQHFPPNAAAIIVGNKCDLCSTRRVISEERGQQVN